MKTRLISLTALILLSALSLHAQIGFGVKGGLNFQNVNGKDIDGNKRENGLSTGFHIGATVDIPVAPDFYFQPALLLSTKGTKYKILMVKSTSDYDAALHLTYLELPLNLLYKPKLGSGHILLGFGPYLAYGISGKIKFLDSNDKVDVKFKGTVKESDNSSYAYFKGFDAGANIFFGYELSMGLFVTLNTQLGMLNMIPEYDGSTPDSGSMKNTGFGLSVGYKF
jgi:hypothetical protein